MTARERFLSARVLLAIKRNAGYANKIGLHGELKKNIKKKRKSASTDNLVKGREAVI